MADLRWLLIGLFFCAAFVAAIVPALRSFRVDPAGALRHE
jgi:ABC-type lipoprotein release transport system permease subunit